ncbi:MAG: PEP-CTERM sorting domain-containing protein [Pseudomonadota bacterium]|jgi:hypothetical protein
MKNIFKALAVSVALGASSLASASVVSLPGNVTLDPLQGGDPTQGQGNFNNGFEFVQWWENAGTPTSLSSLSLANIGDFTLNGYGELTGSGLGKFECNGCEFTFKFSDIGLGFDVLAGSRTEANLLQAYEDAGLSNFGITFEQYIQNQVNNGNLFLDPNTNEVLYLGIQPASGILDIYIDYTPDLEIDENNVVANAPNAGDGDLWLKLSFIDSVYSADSIGDGVFGLSAGDSDFSLNAVGGLAMVSFTEAEDISWVEAGLEQLSDVIGFGLSAQFNEDGNGDLEVYSAVGNGNVRGNVVSAPSTIALFGLALVGLGAMTRRRKA